LVLRAIAPVEQQKRRSRANAEPAVRAFSVAAEPVSRPTPLAPEPILLDAIRALRELRDEGLLEFRRGRGITVTGTPEQSAVVERAKELLHYARTQGYKPDELIRVIQQLG